MRKHLGKLGKVYVGLFPHTATPLLLLCAAFFFALPNAANAQIWVTSGFKATPGAQTETAYCSTSAVDPATGQPSPAAADYKHFDAYCTVHPSTGAAITTPDCSNGPYNNPVGSTAAGNPTGVCSIVFQPQPGVTYTINSNHWLVPYMLPLAQCGYQDYRAYCLSDPLGYYSLNVSATDPWPTTPTYTGVSSINTVDDPCSAMGACLPQNISDIYCTNYITFFGLPICQSGGISVPDV